VPGIIRVHTDRVALAVEAVDRMTGSPNPNGIYAARLLEADRPIAGFRLDQVGYEATRYQNAHADFMRRSAGGPWLQFLMPLPGDTLSAIRSPAGSPTGIRLTDTLPRRFRISVADAAGNTREADFTLQWSGTVRRPPVPDGMLMAPGHVGVFETASLQVVLDEQALYDTIRFQHTERPGQGPLSFSAVHRLHRTDVPVHSYYTVSLQPSRPVPAALADRMVIRRTGRGSPLVRKATLQAGAYAARFREFGDVELLADDSPPAIAFPGLKEGGRLAGSTLAVRVTDNLGAVRNFRGELDGRWLLFAQQGGTYTYRVDERCPPGRHTLIVSAEDEAGNKSVRSVVFNR
jgi:hypothetical protein